MGLNLDQIISLVVDNVNAFSLEKILISLEESKSGFSVKLSSKDGRITSKAFEGVAIDECSFKISNLKRGLSSADFLSQVGIRVERLVVRISADLINSFLSSPAFNAELKRNAPVEINGLRLVFAGGKVSIRGEIKKIITCPFSIDIGFRAVNNCIKIVFENFWTADIMPLPMMFRKLIMSFAQQEINKMKSLRGVVEITDDYAIINPWSKVPIPNLNAQFSHFGVDGKYFVVTLGSAEEIEPQKVEEKKELKAEIVPPDSIEVYKDDKGEFILPLPDL